MITIQRNIEPEMCTFVDSKENSLTIEVVLPDVSKQDISLKINSRCMILSAAAQNVSYSKYLSFRAPVIAAKAKAVYEHGLLRITLPLRA